MKLSQFTLELNVFLFVFFLTVAFVGGVLYRRKQLIQLSDKIYDTEKELMRVNNEIYTHLEQNKKLEDELKSVKNNTPSQSNIQDQKVKDIRLGKIG
jgi:hypothetical protein